MTSSLRVVDSSVWIEWLTGSTLGKRLRKEMPARQSCIVPTIVQLELAKWLLRERDEDEADRFIAYTLRCVVVPLDTEIALLAADMHCRHKLATADAIVFATAWQQKAELVTCDTHFAGLSGVRLFAKPQ